MQNDNLQPGTPTGDNFGTLLGGNQSLIANSSVLNGMK